MTKTPTLKTQSYRVDRSHYSDNLDRMHTLASQIEEATSELHKLARLARKEGATWTDIGRELGVTRSAAQQRFGA
jgi:Flp pilus assembly protein TadD